MIKIMKLRKWKNIIKKSGLFDLKYYLFTYPDVRQQDVDPIKHYVKFGADEGRNPSNEFNTNFYLEQYEDIRNADINPLVHYILHGQSEGRLKNREELMIQTIEENGLFDQEYYILTYPDLKLDTMSPIKHYVKFGADERRNPSNEFNTNFYLEQYEDIRNSDINPLVHYILYGQSNGHSKNREEFMIQTIEESGLFDLEYYLLTYPDVKFNDIDPVKHYIKSGANEGRNPSEAFETKFYCEQYEDVRNSDINPLFHYILFGKDKGRKCLKSEIIPDDKMNTTYFEELFHNNNNRSSDYLDFKTHKPIKTDLKLIAFYLPQFHPLPENDKAWGKGFTEWTNVSKSLPQFEGHYQPRLPGELGYYDLRLIDIQKRQIELAKNYGLHGFCYHYYWFAGKKVMDKPIQQILDNPGLDFPFCINWANENWTKRWDGLDQEIILKQEHSSEDDIAFLETIKPILTDKRYIKIDGKALLMIYQPLLFPDITATVKRWRKHAEKIGIGELYLVLAHSFDHQDPREIGFDAATEFAPNNFQVKNLNLEIKTFNSFYEGHVYDYKSAINYSIGMKDTEYTKFKSICPSWDNEARKPGQGTSFINVTPEAYAKWLEYLLYDTNDNRSYDEKIIFINAWNEWAEGAYLEPDRKFGYAYLDATYQQLSKFDSSRLQVLKNTQKQPKLSDTAVILHLYYVDLWDEIRKVLKNFIEPVDLYININNNSSITTIKKIINEYPSARIYSYENRGRDIFPFIKTMKIISSMNYRYICKIHSKKSLHRVDGDNWRNHLIDSLIGSEERISIAKDEINNGAGIVVAKGNVFPYKKWIGSNSELVENFAKKSGIHQPNDFNFPAGSMFWFKPIIMNKLIEYFDDSLLPFENGQIDGTKAHAVERIFGLLCHDMKVLLKEI